MYLVFHARPAAAPSHAHDRTVPRRSTPTVAQIVSAQPSWSNETVWNIALLPTTSGVTAMAAISWARRAPPRSRATAAVTRITPAPANDARVRRPTSEDQPKTTRLSAASHGVTAGKST